MVASPPSKAAYPKDHVIAIRVIVMKIPIMDCTAELWGPEAIKNNLCS